MTGGGITVWWTELTVGDPEVLSADEVARAERFRDSQDRRRFVAGRSWLRSMLATLTGIEPDAHRFEYGVMGKPSLIDRGDLQFNLSHAGDLAVLAAGRSGPVGIDVERVRPGVFDRSAASLVLSPEELAHIEASPDPDATFVAVWTRKEAYAKVDGEGLGRGLAAFTLGERDDAHRDGITVRSVDIEFDRSACAVAARSGGVIDMVGRA